MFSQDLFLKGQNGVLGSGVKNGVCLQPPNHVFYHCQHIMLALAVSLQQCDAIDLPGLPILTLTTTPQPQELYPLGLLDHSTLFTIMDYSGYSVHS